MNRFAAVTLASFLSFAPLAYAQEAAAAPPADAAPASAPADTAPADPAPANAPAVPVDTASAAPDMAPEPEVSATDTPADVVSDPALVSNATTTDTTSTPLQDTTNTQDTVDGTALQGAANPEDSATTTVAVDASTTEATSTPLAVDATSTPESIAVDASTTLDVVAQDVQPSDAAPDVPPADTQQQEAPLDQPPADKTSEPVSIPAADLAPKPEYTFAMTGTHIAAKRTVRDAAGKQQTVDVAQTVTPRIDNATGVMQVSGSCSNTYYVILLFKNQDDYARDPKSYILDKAFPCENGSFTYAISDLPSSLADGTYYLLVGEEGDKGPWAPITGLTEVTINRNH